MSYKFNPFTGKLDDVGTGSSSSSGIPQYDTDPASPSAHDTWVLRGTTGAGGGKLQYLFGLGMPINTTGVATNTYSLSYYTEQGTIVRTNLT